MPTNPLINLKHTLANLPIACACLLLVIGCSEETPAAKAPVEKVAPEQNSAESKHSHVFDSKLLEEWVDAVDWTAPSIAPIIQFRQKDGDAAAFQAWVLSKIEALRLSDYGKFGWHDFHIHPKRQGIADLLSGHIDPEAYYARSEDEIQFLDIYGIRRAISGTEAVPINWFVDRRDSSVWAPYPEMSMQDRLNKTEYVTFEIFNSFAGRYWQTEDASYRRALLRLLGDFHSLHAQGFWHNYYEKGAKDDDVKYIYQVDWRQETNGLHEGWNALNTLRALAALAKTAGAERPATWADILAPIGNTTEPANWETEELENWGRILLGLSENYPEKLLWFIEGNSIANQKMEALSALFRIKTLLPELRGTADYSQRTDYLFEKFLSDNFLPDGGMIEQSLNYNLGTKEKVMGVPLDDPKLKASRTAETARFDALIDGITDPLGATPTIGNNSLEDAPALWQSEALRNAHFRTNTASSISDSLSFPYSGFHALRNGNEWDDTWLFFKNSRLQRGHLCHDNNGIQLTALGRRMLTYGGPPNYHLGTSKTAQITERYLSEASTFKTNTVIVNGTSQGDTSAPLQAAPNSPISAAWHDSEHFALVDGLYRRGYGGVNIEGSRIVPAGFEHLRTVYFFKQQGVILVIDRMFYPAVDQAPEFRQVWNFPPVISTGKKELAGFTKNDFEHNTETRTLRTTDQNGPNLVMLHDGIDRLKYLPYFGDAENELGWFAQGIGTVSPAMDYHVAWQADSGKPLLTWLIPVPAQGEIPIRTKAVDSSGRPADSAIRLADGTVLAYSQSTPDQIGLPQDSPAAADESIWITTSSAGAPTQQILVNRSRDAGGGFLADDTQISEWTLTNSVYQPVKQTYAFTQDYNADTKSRSPYFEKASQLSRDTVNGWRVSSTKLVDPMRTYDSILTTQFRSETTTTKAGLTPEPVKHLTSVFGGWIQIPEKGAYQIRFKAMRSGMVNLITKNGLALPPIASVRNNDEVSNTRHFEAGWHYFEIGVTGFYNTVPSVELSINHAETGKAVPLQPKHSILN